MMHNSQAHGVQWAQPMKRVRTQDASGAGHAGGGRAWGVAEHSAFPVVGVPATFARDKVKGFLKQQRKATRAAAAGGVLAVAAAQFLSSPGPVRYGMGEFRDNSVDGMDGVAVECDNKNGEECPRSKHVFTRADVERILHDALREQELELRQQYDAILRRQLHEQFSNFKRFNQDHIARSLQRSEHDYFD